MTTTEGKLYLTSMTTLDRVEIQFMPKTLSTNRSSVWAEIAVVGRNNPFNQYTGGNNSLTLELDFLATDDQREDVVERCRMIESWAMNDGYENPPQVIRVTWGKFFKEKELWVIKNVQTDYSRFSANHDMMPTQAYMQLELAMDTQTNRKTSDVQWR